jgi:hypothetical protein
MNFLCLLFYFLEEGVLEHLIPLAPDRVKKLHEIAWSALCGSISQQEAVSLVGDVMKDMINAREQAESAVQLDVTIAFASFLQTLIPTLPPSSGFVEETELEEETEMLLNIFHGTRILRDGNALAEQRSHGYALAQVNRDNLRTWLKLIDAEIEKEEEAIDATYR